MWTIFIDWILGTKYLWEYKLEDLKPGDKIMADYAFGTARGIVLINNVERKRILVKFAHSTIWRSYNSHNFEDYKL